MAQLGESEQQLDDLQSQLSVASKESSKVYPH